MAGSPKRKSVRITPADQSKYKAPALDKGLDILELFVEEDSPLALSEVARKLNRSVGEIFRMVATLVRRGYLRLDPGTDLYELTLKMFRLSHRHMPVQELSSAAAVPLKQLAKTLSQSCHVAVAFNGRALILMQENSPTNRCFRVRLGADLALASTCSGKILLAFMSEEEREEMMEQAKRLGGHYAEKDANLPVILERIRKRGVHQEKSNFTQGVTDMGCPLFGHNGELKGALTVPYLGRIDRNQIDIRTTKKKLLETAQYISEAMGYDAERRRADS